MDGSYKKSQDMLRMHWCIDGHPYTTMSHIFRVAQGRGYSGCSDTLRFRLKSGASTWTELLTEPRSKKPDLSAKVAKKAAAKAEMVALIAEIDARKVKP